MGGKSIGFAGGGAAGGTGGLSGLLNLRIQRKVSEALLAL